MSKDYYSLNMPFWNKMLHKRNKINKSAQRVTLLDIPEEIVRYIARYVMIEDVLHLSMTCKILNHMLPKYSFEYKKLDMSSIGSCPSWTGLSYFDSPPLTSHIFMVTMSGLTWYDVGRTKFFIQLIRPQYVSKESIIIASHQCPANDLPYRMESMVQFLTMKDPIMNLIQPGDYFRFIKAEPFKDFRVHTRSIRSRPNTTAQKGDCNALTQDNSEMLHRQKESFANIIEMFKKQDEKEILKKQDKKTRKELERYRLILQDITSHKRDF